MGETRVAMHDRATSTDSFYAVFDRLARLSRQWDMLSDDVPNDVREDFDDLCRLFIALHPRREPSIL
jgi:hypothetical protein